MNDNNPQIPGFRILELLGKGAMARVYLAVDESLDRKVALKVMMGSLASDQSFRERFLAEARDTAKFSHHGIVSIHSTGVHEDQYYLVLEYLEAGTLKDRLQARREHSREKGEPADTGYSPREALIVTRQVAEALAYAHSKNVIHRDLKPANILFSQEGAAVLSDFGIAKSVSANRELTMTGYSVGTPAYMSPEQKLGADIDTRSDLYSLGIVLYELLTGHKPFKTRPGNFDDLKRELDADVPRLEGPCAEIQPILDRLLAKDPGGRFESANELIRAIEQLPLFHGVTGDETVIQHSPAASGAAASGVAPPTTPATLIPDSIGKRALLAAGGAGLLLAIILAVWLWPGGKPEVEPVDPETAATIEALLERADLYADNDWLIEPPGTNAVEALQRVLQLQRGNPDALGRLAELEAQVVVLAETTVDSGDRQLSQDTVELALFYFPDNEELADLKAEFQ